MEKYTKEELIEICKNGTKKYFPKLSYQEATLKEFKEVTNNNYTQELYDLFIDACSWYGIKYLQEHYDLFEATIYKYLPE